MDQAPNISQAMYNLYESIVPGYTDERIKKSKAYDAMMKRTAEDDGKSELKTTIKTLKLLKD